jgi:hypothetical protein
VEYRYGYKFTCFKYCTPYNTITARERRLNRGLWSAGADTVMIFDNRFNVWLERIETDD